MDDQPEELDERFRTAAASLRFDQIAPPDLGELTTGDLLAIFDAQLASRHADLAARRMQRAGRGYYTISSAGHEGDAPIAYAVRDTDPVLPHYRFGGFYLARAGRVGHDGVSDILLGVAAAATEPMAGGRHKVLGNADLNVIPQTSTIASHLPRAMGLAFAIGRAAKLGATTPWPADALVVCGLGDASVNHSTATGAINAATYSAHRGLPMPLLVVCEDNGYGISVPTPPDWVGAAYGSRPHLGYFTADGSDPLSVYREATRAADWVRTRRQPAFLRLRTVRYLGHAGSDAEVGYRSRAEIAQDYPRDPLLGTALDLVALGALSPDEVLDRYERTRERVWAVAERALTEPELTDASSVMAPLAPRHPDRVAARAARAGTDRRAAFGDRPPEDEGPLTLAQSINRALADLCVARPETLVFGEDVAVKGGVYGVTRGLLKRFGPARVFDTLLDEQSILGLGLGAGLAGMLPIPEIQYLAYLHNAADQVRGEAATLRFFSAGQYRNPMVVRIAGLAYQKGFGGHFHNDNALGALRDIPGLVIAVPARPDDAAPMLRAAAAAAVEDGTVSVFLEPIALYHTRDLHTEGDGAWLAPYRGPKEWSDAHVPVGRGRVHGDGTDLTVVTFGNGLPMSLRVARRLADRGIGTRVLDLRWLAPLPVADLLEAARTTGRVLVADETRRTGGVSEGVLTALVDAGFTGQVARVTSEDSFIPLGAAAGRVLLSEAAIEDAALAMVKA